jgi:hypothetical protein
VLFRDLIFNLVYVWPIIERKFTKRQRVAQPARSPERPTQAHRRGRHGAGSFLGMLFIASSTDVIANFFNVSLNDVLWAMRYLTVIVPILAFPITYRICHEIQALHGGGRRKTPNVVTRSEEGEYIRDAVAALRGRRAESSRSDSGADVHPRRADESGDSGVRVVDR